MIVGQSSADELFLLKKKFTTDFAGSMYPSGFKIMKTVRAYVEKEDELDKVVRNENGNEGITRVVSESFMKNAKLGADNVENAQQDGLAALQMCTVIGDANTERKEGSIGDVEVDIFTNITSSSKIPSLESVVDIRQENTRPNFAWTTEDFNYFEAQ